MSPTRLAQNKNALIISMNSWFHRHPHLFARGVQPDTTAIHSDHGIVVSRPIYYLPATRSRKDRISGSSSEGGQESKKVSRIVFFFVGRSLRATNI